MSRLLTPALDAWRDRVARKLPASAGLVSAARWEAAALEALGARLPNSRVRAEACLERAAEAIDADAAALVEVVAFEDQRSAAAPTRAEREPLHRSAKALVGSWGRV